MTKRMEMDPERFVRLRVVLNQGGDPRRCRVTDEQGRDVPVARVELMADPASGRMDVVLRVEVGLVDLELSA